MRGNIHVYEDVLYNRGDLTNQCGKDGLSAYIGMIGYSHGNWV